MKAKGRILFVSVITSLLMITAGAGAWEEALTTYNQITVAKPRQKVVAKAAPAAQPISELTNAVTTAGACTLIGTTTAAIQIAFTDTITETKKETKKGIESGTVMETATGMPMTTPSSDNGATASGAESTNQPGLILDMSTKTTPSAITPIDPKRKN